MTSDISPRLANLPTWQISQASARSHKVLHQRLAEAGSSGYEYRILAVLGDLGLASQADLGRAAALDRRDISHTVRGLEARKLVSRSADPSDARQTLVELTGVGNSLLQLLDRVVDEVQDEVFAPLAATQRRTLLHLLRRLS
ncbi:MAG: MarR family winged helix-turn-helix transcriptional regulator [Acidimicrobiales bacterium]